MDMEEPVGRRLRSGDSGAAVRKCKSILPKMVLVSEDRLSSLRSTTIEARKRGLEGRRLKARKSRKTSHNTAQKEIAVEALPERDANSTKDASMPESQANSGLETVGKLDRKKRKCEDVEKLSEVAERKSSLRSSTIQMTKRGSQLLCGSSSKTKRVKRHADVDQPFSPKTPEKQAPPKKLAKRQNSVSSGNSIEAGGREPGLADAKLKPLNSEECGQLSTSSEGSLPPSLEIGSGDGGEAKNDVVDKLLESCSREVTLEGDMLESTEAGGRESGLDDAKRKPANLEESRELPLSPQGSLPLFPQTGPRDGGAATNDLSDKDLEACSMRFNVEGDIFERKVGIEEITLPLPQFDVPDEAIHSLHQPLEDKRFGGSEDMLTPTTSSSHSRSMRIATKLQVMKKLGQEFAMDETGSFVFEGQHISHRPVRIEESGADLGHTEVSNTDPTEGMRNCGLLQAEVNRKPGLEDHEQPGKVSSLPATSEKYVPVFEGTSVRESAPPTSQVPSFNCIRKEQKRRLLVMDPELSELCGTLQVPDNVATYARELLSHVMINFTMPEGPRDLIVMVELSLCLIAGAHLHVVLEPLPAVHIVGKHMNMFFGEETFTAVHSRLMNMCKSKAGRPPKEQRQRLSPGVTGNLRHHAQECIQDSALPASKPPSALYQPLPPVLAPREPFVATGPILRRAPGSSPCNAQQKLSMDQKLSSQDSMVSESKPKRDLCQGGQFLRSGPNGLHQAPDQPLEVIETPEFQFSALGSLEPIPQPSGESHQPSSFNCHQNLTERNLPSSISVPRVQLQSQSKRLSLKSSADMESMIKPERESEPVSLSANELEHCTESQCALPNSGSESELEPLHRSGSQFLHKTESLQEPPLQELCPMRAKTQLLSQSPLETKQRLLPREQPVVSQIPRLQTVVHSQCQSQRMSSLPGATSSADADPLAGQTNPQMLSVRVEEGCMEQSGLGLDPHAHEMSRLIHQVEEVILMYKQKCKHICAQCEGADKELAQRYEAELQQLQQEMKQTTDILWVKIDRAHRSSLLAEALVMKEYLGLPEKLSTVLFQPSDRTTGKEEASNNHARVAGPTSLQPSLSSCFATSHGTNS